MTIKEAVKEKVALTYSGWKDFLTYSHDDTHNWVRPETIIEEIKNASDLPDILTTSGTSYPAMMLTTALASAMTNNVDLAEPLKKYVDTQIKTVLNVEKASRDQSTLLHEWLWNIRQLGIKGIPDDFGVRDLGDHEVYQYRLALQIAGVHPLRYQSGEDFIRVLDAFRPERRPPYDLNVKFYEREAFVNVLIDPTLAGQTRQTSLLEALSVLDHNMCELLRRDLPLKNVGLRSKPEDIVTLVKAGEELSGIEITSPDQVPVAIEQIELMNKQWLSKGPEHCRDTAKDQFIKIWNAIKVIQPLKENNTRVGFILAAHLTEPYLNRQLPDAFTGSDFGAKTSFLYDDRDPITLGPSRIMLERIASEMRLSTWVNKSAFVSDIREKGFIIGWREWERNKMKWRE